MGLPGTYGAGADVLVTARSATCGTWRTVTESSGDWMPSAFACAMLVIDPAVTSAGVTVYVAVQSSASPGSRSVSLSPTVVTAGHETGVFVSDTVTGPASEVLPVFVTR